MDAAAEALMRSMIHDMANTLSGIQGILEIQAPDRPLSPRSLARLEAALSEGLSTLERSRHLAMGTFPDAGLEPGPQWRSLLLQRLAPLGGIFGCHLDVQLSGDPDLDQWPGERLRALAQALTRTVLPYLEGPTLHLEGRSEAHGWTLHWTHLSDLPEGLQDPERPRDTACRWVLALATQLNLQLTFQDRALTVTIPRVVG